MELLIVESTQKILDESNNKLTQKNKKYYRDVLDFLFLVFQDNNQEKNNDEVKYPNNIYQIKFKNITLNENVFQMYNQIIKKYNLNKPEFITDAFDLSEIDNPNEIKDIFYDIAQTLSNNLLEKINYKLVKKINKEDKKIKFILKYIN